MGSRPTGFFSDLESRQITQRNAVDVKLRDVDSPQKKLCWRESQIDVLDLQPPLPGGGDPNPANTHAKWHQTGNRLNFRVSYPSRLQRYRDNVRDFTLDPRRLE